MIPVCQPTIETEDLRAVESAMKSRWLSTGKLVSQFEEALALRTAYPHVVALSSCTAALFLSMKAHGIGPGDRVGIPALTFTATAAAAVHAGAKVEFLDVDPLSWRWDGHAPDGLSLIVPVNLYGQASCQRQPHKVPLIVDGAHSIGADVIEGETVCLSFYATKNISTLGEGGAVLTTNRNVADWIRRASLHGLAESAWDRFSVGARAPEVRQLGWKANMTDPQAAMGLAQLRRLPEWRERRERLAERYDAGLDMVVPTRHDDGVVHLYPIQLPKDIDRDWFRAHLAADGIGTGIHYTALTEEPHWRSLNPAASCPIAEHLGRRVVTLPLYPHMSNADQDAVIRAVDHALGLKTEAKCAS